MYIEPNAYKLKARKLNKLLHSNLAHLNFRKKNAPATIANMLPCIAHSELHQLEIFVKVSKQKACNAHRDYRIRLIDGRPEI